LNVHVCILIGFFTAWTTTDNSAFSAFFVPCTQN
jgi:hypothetical protein